MNTTTNPQTTPPSPLPTAHISTPTKPPTYTSDVSALDLEAQNTQWTAPPPPAYYPNPTKAPPIPMRLAVPRQDERTRRHRTSLACCLLLAIALIAIFVAVTVVEVVARVRYAQDRD